MHGERFDAQPGHGGGPRRLRDLRHRDAEVAGAVADAREAHPHAHPAHARGARPAQLGEAVRDDEGVVAAGALEQRVGLRGPVDDDVGPVGAADCPRQAVLRLGADLVRRAFGRDRAQDRRHAVRLVGVGDDHVRPLRAPSRGEGAIAVSDDVQVRQPQRRPVLGEQFRDVHLCPPPATILRRRPRGRDQACTVRPRTRSAARSPTMIVGAFVLPPGITGMTEASATRSPSSPRTRSSGSTTA